MQQANIEIQPHIPFHIRLQLSQLDVYLDKSWHSTLVEVFRTQDKAVQKLIYEQILVPKGIEFNAETQEFIKTQPRLTLNALRSQLTAPQTRMLAQNLLESLDVIAKETNFVKLGEYLESILAQIDELNTEEQPQINVEKELIKKHFLYDIEKIIDCNHYQIPKNIRGLNEQQLKSFINDVYIRKQVAGFSFNPVRSQILKHENSPIIDYIIEQRKTRLFEVYEGSQYYYLVTPANNNEDPYSIRRFLLEEASRLNDFYYLNGTILDKKLLKQSAII